MYSDIVQSRTSCFMQAEAVGPCSVRTLLHALKQTIKQRMGNGQKTNPGFYGKHSQSPFYTKTSSLSQRIFFKAYKKYFLLYTYMDPKRIST